MHVRILSYVLIWTSFYEQLAWAPVLVGMAAARGDAASIALAASAYSAANLVGNLLFGHLSDRLDRFRVAGSGLIAMSGTALLHIASASPAMLIGARALHGLAAAAVAPAALAAISDGAAQHRRGEVMARVGLVIALASMFSPLTSGRIAATFGDHMAVVVLAVVVAAMGTTTLLARRGIAAPSIRRRTAADSGGGSLDVMPLITAAAVAFALMFAQSVLFYALPLKGHYLGMGPGTVGPLLGVFALGAFLAFIPPLSRVGDRRGRGGPLIAGLALVAAGLMGLVWALGVRELAIGLFVYGLGFGLVFPAVSAVSADSAGPGRQGLAFGLLTAAFSAGAITGPMLTRMLSSVLSPFAVAGAAAAVAAVVAGLLYGWSRRVPPAPKPQSPERLHKLP